MLPSQIDEYTLQDIEMAYVGRLIDNDRQERKEWERARMLAFYSISPHAKNIKDPKQLFKFEDERQKTIETIKRIKESKMFPETI